MGGLTLPLVGVTVPERNLDEHERALARETILTAYDHFVRAVAKARGLEESFVREIAEGRVYSGRDGIEKRIVDRVATLEETIESAKRAAGIAPGRKVRVIEYPKPPLFRLPGFVPPFVRGLVGGGGGTAPAEPAAASLLPSTYEGRALKLLLQHPGQPLLLAPGAVLPDEEPVTH
jgi:protease-4